jgi:hypothetical protein
MTFDEEINYLADRGYHLKRVRITDVEEKGNKKEKIRAGFEITNVEGKFVLYRLTYDFDLSKRLPNGHIYEGRFATAGEAFFRSR